MRTKYLFGVAIFAMAALYVTAGALAQTSPRDVGSTLQVHINDDGKTSVDGAKVTGISGTVISATTTVGSFVTNWKINTSESTSIIRRYGGTALLSEIQTNDYISFSGPLDATATEATVNASSVKDWSIQESNSSFSGRITSINSSNTSFVLTRSNTETITVVVSTSTKIKRSNANIAFSDLKVGDNVVSTSGLYNNTSKVLQADTINVKSCGPKWQTGDWTPNICPASGQQTRTVTDANNCGVDTEKPKTTRTCTTNTPTITVTYPNGGEKFLKGKDLVVKWTSKFVDTVNIKALYYNTDGVLDENNPANAGTCMFTATPVSAKSGRFTVKGSETDQCRGLNAGDKVKIEIKSVPAAGQEVAADTSNDFFSVAAGCVDYDITAQYPDGKNFFQKERVEYIYGGKVITRTDSCSNSTTLMEYFCENGQSNRVEQYCQGGCSNGACRSATAAASDNSFIGSLADAIRSFFFGQ